MIAAKRWIVAGDVLNAAKPAHDIVKRLAQHQRAVWPLNPRLGDVDVQKQMESNKPSNEFEKPVTNSMQSITDTIDVLDLCIHPALGLSIVQQAKEKGIKNVFIQPGAGSEDILKYCKDNQLNVHEGCVLREMK